MSALLAPVLILLASTSAIAQSPNRPLVAASPRALSASDAMSMAVAASETVAIARAGVQRADGEKVRARSEWLPSATASASYDRTIESEFEAIFQQPTPAPGAGTPPPPLPVLPFGQKNAYRFGVSATQNLFTGGRAAARWRLALSSRRAAELGLASTRAAVVLEAATAYFELVLAERLVAIAEASLRQAERVVKVTETGFAAGTRSEFDQLRAQVAVANQRPLLVRRRGDLRLAELRLRQLLDLPGEAPISLTTELEGDSEVLAARARTLVEAAPPPASIPVQAAETAVRSAEAAVALARRQWLPGVALGTQYGRVAYPENLLTGWGQLRTNWSVGLSLVWPFLAGGRIHGDVKVAQAEQRQAEQRLQQVRELAALATASARAELSAARATFAASSGTVEQARRAVELAELRYAEGVSTQIEVGDARLQLDEAEVTRSLAARSLQLAHIRLALTPTLPLEAGLGEPVVAPPAMRAGPPAARVPSDPPGLVAGPRIR